MPCTGGPSAAQVQQEQVDTLTQMLCEVLRELKRPDASFANLSGQVKGWSARHDEEDRRRAAKVSEQQAKETTKQQALAKLSSEERKSLGLI